MSSHKYQKTHDTFYRERHTLKGICRIFFKQTILHFSLFTFLLLSFSLSSAAEVIGPEIKSQDRDLYVSTGLALDENSLEELRNGVTKEFRLHVDLFRVWNMWPDEFILSRSFIRTLRSDPVKMEYTATSGDGNTLTQRRFKSFESMVQWALSINNVKLANTRDLDPGVYFVRVTAESRIRKLPPVIGYFMIFLPENEFTIKKDSAPITIGAVK
jgi:hypothetical protein